MTEPLYSLTEMQRILIIEDERDIADLIAFNLERAGYGVLKAHDGITGAQLAIHEPTDLIILDLMLPGKDGYAVFKEIRRDARSRDTPVIMLTARAQTEDRIQGLEAGADDYLTKPFSPKELLLRVQAVLKRADNTPGAVVVEYGPFRFNKNDLKFYLDGDPIDLTSTEFKLLLFLTERAGRPQDRNDLLRSVWGYSDDVHSRTLDTHMKRLRQKLGSHAGMVETVRGIGYRVASS
jgi:two-component system phosphate regulon response regulator PhoB